MRQEIVADKEAHEDPVVYGPLQVELEAGRVGDAGQLLGQVFFEDGEAQKDVLGLCGHVGVCHLVVGAALLARHTCALLCNN